MKELISVEQLQKRVAELAEQIGRDYRGRSLTIVGVLTGSLIFLADLVRLLNLPLRIGLIQASSYRGQATRPGTLQVGPDLTPDLRGRHVLLLDDIVDSGRTLDHLTRHIQSLGVASLRVAVLLRKQGRQEVTWCRTTSVLTKSPTVSSFGYGLGFNDEFRHLPYWPNWKRMSNACG